MNEVTNMPIVKGKHRVRGKWVNARKKKKLLPYGAVRKRGTVVVKKRKRKIKKKK